MPQDRPPVPADLRRRVLVEAGHRCAIPTCRHIDVDVHHIIPWEQCQAHEYKNLIALCPNCHRRADRGEIDRKSLRIYKANLRYTHDRFSQFEVDFLFEAYRVGAGGGSIQWPPYLLLLVKRLLEAGYLSVESREGGIFHDGLRVNPDKVAITAKGKQFIDSLGLEMPEA